MGYWVRYSFHNVRILAPQAGAALAAIHALYLPETIEKFGTALICDRTFNYQSCGLRNVCNV